MVPKPEICQYAGYLKFHIKLQKKKGSSIHRRQPFMHWKGKETARC